MGRSRFLLPVLFSVVGIASTIFSIYWVTKDFRFLSFLTFIEGTLYTDILIVLAVAIPVIALEYFIIAIPMAAFYLFAQRIIKVRAYDIDIMRIGPNFGGIRMLRRAALPALFSVSTAGLAGGILSRYLFDDSSSLNANLQFLYPISLTLMGALLVMPIALALFVPTWILNDAGIVSHLKEQQLETRQCPDTEGVGKWYSNMLGGYSIISFPISMFIQHFFNPYVIAGRSPVLPGVPLWNSPIFISFLWTGGIPLLVMSFIVPVIMLNEVARNRVGRTIKGIAKRFGADEVHTPIIGRAQSDILPDEEDTGYSQG
jgi:hypothetical protein